MEQMQKSGFATLIGRPNVGKSTLMNRLIGQKIAITSNKPQTTRNRIQTVYTCDQGQIIFLDTPGIHKAKNKLGEYMVNVAEHTLKEVDLVLWLVEPSTFIGAGERHIAEQLSGVKTPVILVINKIDQVKKQEEILTFIDAYKDICPFAEIVPLSALKDRNTDLLLELIFKYLPYGPQFYDEDTVTDQPMRQIAAELIREFPDTHLLIIGDGPMYDELRRRIAGLGLTGHFHFAGLIAPDQVARHLAQADLLWHLSLREGLPRSVVQALATGIPAIGYRLDGTPEVILDGQTGFCIEPEKVEQVVEATRKIWRDDALRETMGRNGRELVRERFDWRRMADILEAEYLALAAAKRA